MTTWTSNGRRWMAGVVAATVLAALTACGGGGDAAADALGAGGGTFTGDLSQVAGTYQVSVLAYGQTECEGDPIELPGGGTITSTWDSATETCVIEQSPATGPAFTERRKSVLPPGNYTLTISNEGVIELGNGSTNKYRLACPVGGTCRVDPAGSTALLTVAGATGSVGTASAAISQVSIFTGATPKYVVAGTFYGVIASADTPALAEGVSGVIVFEDADI